MDLKFGMEGAAWTWLGLSWKLILRPINGQSIPGVGSEVGITAEGAGRLGLVTEETMTCC